MTTETLTELARLTTDELLGSHLEAQAQIRKYELEKYEIEAELRRRMTEGGITIVESAEAVATLKPVNDYDRQALTAIRELLDPAEYALLLTKPKEAEINITKAKELAKRVPGIRAILESATRPGVARLSIERRD